MPIIVEVQDLQYTNNFCAGNTAGLTGSVMEQVEAYVKIKVTARAEATDANNFICTQGTTDSSIRRTTGKWSDDGIGIGSIVTFTMNFNSAAGSYSGTNFTVLFSDETTIYLDQPFVEAGAVVNPATITGNDYNYVLLGEYPSSVIYKFGLIENDEPINFISKVTGEECSYYIADLSENVYDHLKPSGIYNSWRSTISGTKQVARSGQTYWLKHKFFIAPWYVDGQLDNLKENIMPELFDGNFSLKHAIQLTLKRSISDSLGDIVANVENFKGSVGWFNENLNGYTSNYAVESVEYRDFSSDQLIDAVNISGRTKVEVLVSKILGSFSADEKAGVYMSYLPPSEDYTNNQNDMFTNFMYAFALNTTGSPATNYHYINNMSVTLDSGNLLIYFEIEFSTEQQLRLLDADSPNYLLAIQAGDYSISAENSDRVMLIGDVREFGNEILIEGLAESQDFKIWRHNEDFGSAVGHSDSVLWNESGILAKFDFSLDLSKNAYVYTIEQAVMAYRPTDNTYAELDKISIPAESFDVLNGVQQIDLDRTRGYILADNDQFNYLKVETGTKVGDIQDYTILAGQKIPWQQWQAMLADNDFKTVFYDKTKPNSGINKKSSNYSDVNDFDIVLAYKMKIYGTDDKGQSGITDYVFTSPPLKIYDYGQPTAWTGTIQTFDPDTLADTELQVLDNKYTLFRITWEKAGVVIDDIEDFWAIHRIEPANQQGNAIHELSTIREYPNKNGLIPENGQTQLYMYIDSGKVVTECLINPSNIDVSGGVNLSGEISAGAGGLPEGVKLMEDGTPKLTEGGDYKIVE